MNIPSRVPNEVLVKFRSSPTPSSKDDFLRANDAELIKTYDFGERLNDRFEGQLAHVRLSPDTTPEEAVEHWSGDPRVEYVATNDYVQSFGDGSEKLNPKSWALHNSGQTGGTPDADIDALEAWTQQTGRGANNDGPIIAVLDTGVDLFHEALKPNLWTNPGETPKDGIDNDGNGVVDDIHGYNSRQENGFPLDENGHGTHCAAIIGAADGNSQQISGVMKRTQIAGVQFLSKLGMGNMADAIEGIAYADRIGARIVSNSWGGGPYNRALKDVIAASPALHVFAAGNESNDNDQNLTYPASYDLPNIVSVAATDHNDQLAEFSNYGAQQVDLAAPGVNIYSAVNSGEYKELSGTSMAAPFVSGAAGLVVSEFPDIDNEQLKARLLNSVDSLESLQGRVKTGGRLNVARALERDQVAPDMAGNFVARAVAPGRVEVSFQPSGDDGMRGEASLYRVRVSEDPNLEQSTVVAEGRNPGREPVRLELKTPRWAENKKLYYAVELEDNVGNRSEPAVSPVLLPGSKVLFGPGDAGDKETWKSRWEFAQVEEPGRGKVWTDSPEGDYKTTGGWLQSRDIDLSETENPKLVFEAKTDLENERDFLEIQVGVKTHPVVHQWRTVAKLTGTHDWDLHEIDLSKYAGEEIRVNFKLKPDGSRTQDGVYLDNVALVDDFAQTISDFTASTDISREVSSTNFPPAIFS